MPSDKVELIYFPLSFVANVGETFHKRTKKAAVSTAASLFGRVEKSKSS